MEQTASSELISKRRVIVPIRLDIASQNKGGLLRAKSMFLDQKCASIFEFLLFLNNEAVCFLDKFCLLLLWDQ
jgi:hypothetical protein